MRLVEYGKSQAHRSIRTVILAIDAVRCTRRTA
jgi:hypothetical protein